MAAEDISTLVVQVKSDGIRDTSTDLRALTKAATGAEDAVKKLGTVTVNSGSSTSQATAAVKEATKATDVLEQTTKKLGTTQAALTREQKYDIELRNQQGRAYAQAQAEAIRMNKALEENTKGHGSNAASIRESMVLMHELSQGSYKRFGGSLMVLANQMDLVNKGIDFFKTASLGSAVSAVTMWTGIGLLVGALGMLVVGLAQGARESKAMSDALIMTGNFAGTTVDGMREMAHEVAAVGGTIGHAKEAVTALAASGKFTKESIVGIATAATLMEEAFGVSIDKTVKEFEELATLAVTSSSRSTNAITQHAMKMNDHYHFLSAAQVEHIGNLEKEGKAIEAVKFVTEQLAKTQTDRAEKSISELGYVARAWHGVKAAISGAMSGIAEWGAKSTLAGDLAMNERNRTEQLKMQVTKAGFDQVNKLYDEQAKVIKGKMAKAETDAAEEGEKQLKEQRRSHAEERLRFFYTENDKKYKADVKAAEMQADFDAQTEKYKLEHAKEFAKALQHVKDGGVEKAAKGSDDSASVRDNAIMEIKGQLHDQIMVHEEFQRNSKELAKKQGEDEREQLERRRQDNIERIKDINAAYDKEIAATVEFAKRKHTAVQMSENDKRVIKARKDYDSAIQGVVNAEADDERGVVSREIAEREKLLKTINATGVAENNRLQNLITTEDRRIAQIGQTKSQTALYDAAVAQANADRLSEQKALLENEISWEEQAGHGKDAYVDGLRLQVTYMDTHISQYGVLAKQMKVAATAWQTVEFGERVSKQLDDALAASKRFEKAMTSVFGSVGKAIGGMAVAYQQMNKDQLKAAQDLNKASKEDIASGKAMADFDEATFQAKMDGYAGMADASKNFFEQGSKGYKTLEGVSKVFHAAEIGMTIARTAAKAVEAIMTQGSGDPYTAFARMAAMATIVAGLGFAVGGGFNSSSGGGKSAADVQKEQGTGTVFGDIGVKKDDGTTTFKDKSESISKSLEYLKSNASILLPTNQAMLATLRSIDAHMSGLTNLIARTDGMTNGTNMGIQTGTISRMGTSSGVAGMLGGAAASAAFGTAIGGIGTALLGAATFGIGALAGIVVNKLVSLWGSTKQNIVDSGLQFGGSVSGLKNGSGVSQYASVDTTKSSWFGLSKSTSNSVQTQGVSSELQQQFGLIFSGLEDAMKVAAPMLGQNADAIGKTIENMVITTSQVSLKGLTGTDLTNAINGVISKTMDEIAQKAFPAMGDFRQVGEGYAQTVIRVASGVEQAKSALELLGLKAGDYTKITNKQGDVAVEMTKQSIAAAEGLSGVNAMLQGMDGSLSELVDAYKSLDAIRKQMNGVGLNGSKFNVNTVKGAGGVSELGSALSKYQDKYFTDAQKAAIMTKDLSAQFAKLGLTLPATKAVMQQMIETADKVGGPEGDKLVGQLLVLSGAYSDAIDQTNTANKTATDNLNTSIDALKKFSDSIKSFKDSLLLGALSTLTPMEKLTEAKRQYDETVAKAMSGDQTARDKLTGTAQAYLDASRVVNASDSNYTDSFMKVQADMDKLAAMTDGQISDSQAQLNALNTQIDVLNMLNTTAADINAGIANLVTAIPTIAPSAPAAANNDAVVAELAKLRADAAAQAEATAKQISDLTAATVNSNAKAAADIVDGTTDAMANTAWNRKYGMDTYER